MQLREGAGFVSEFGLNVVFKYERESLRILYKRDGP